MAMDHHKALRVREIEIEIEKEIDLSHIAISHVDVKGIAMLHSFASEDVVESTVATTSNRIYTTTTYAFK
ncbi:hypothetical protein CCACVL1_20547 [Corchorus capsularis]|uniref:Uncharacterized protein n=1 Tax=Corchorus capsularis TaxID=210143 RepID=A0A1R3HAX0_COCAP|nr:hypothetical protein CCACVL1_20547 [Corchorus capsularis]